MKKLASLVAPLLVVVLLSVAASAVANDRDLLYEKKAYPPYVLILVANTESMAGCEPNDVTMPNGQTCTGLATGLGSNLAPFGIGDSVFSKMGKAKSAIESVIEANASKYYFGLSSESYTRQTAPTGTPKRYTFIARQSSFCDSTVTANVDAGGGAYWACQPAGTAANFGAAIGSPTTLTSSGVTYEVIPIGGKPAGSATYTFPTSYNTTGTDLGNESWIQTYGGDANHQPYLVNSSSVGMILTNATGNATTPSGIAANQELAITYSGNTATLTNDPYRIHQCSTNCTLSSSGFDGQTFTVTKKLVECSFTSGSVSSISVSNSGSGYTSVPTVSLSGGGGTGATATASLGVVSMTKTASGSNYTSTPTCTISAPPAGGTQATCTVTVSGKKLNKVSVATAGSGYTGPVTVTITGGGGSGGAATASLGVVSFCTAAASSCPTTSAGSGYTSAPSVTVTGGSGSGAAGTAIVLAGGGGYPCAPTPSNTKSTVTVDYVVPPPASSVATGGGNAYNSSTGAGYNNLLTYCADNDSSCTYPMVYGYGSTNAAAGEEMGWVNYCDLDQSCGAKLGTVSGNQSGWITQKNNNPQPIVMLPHPYTPWKSYTNATPISGTINYTQSSNPCIFRSFRPLSSIIDNSSSHTQTDSYPLFTAATGQTDGSSNLSSTQCDKMVDGLWQTGYFPNGGQNEIAPIIFPAGHNGSGIDLVKILTNAFQYYNGGSSQPCSTAGGGVDGFCAGVRYDDPYKNCRLSAIILITDSFSGSSPDFQFGKSGDPTTSLKGINVPVFVIGYAPAPNSGGTCSLASLPDGTTSLNNGQCIAYYSGATTFDGTEQTQQGYYPVDTSADLAAALTAALNSLDTRIRDFATATIPSVSATSAGIAYLSQFNPRNNRSIWEGHLRAYFLDPTTGLVKAGSTGKPDATQFSFWNGSTGATGSFIWDAGSTNNSGGADSPTGYYSNLDGIRLIDPTLLLTSSPGAGQKWSTDDHDQADSSITVGRNVFFGVKPQDAGCTSMTYDCLVQVPVGTGGTSPTPSLIKAHTTYASAEQAVTNWTAPSPPSSLPTWWTTAQGSTYVRIPGVGVSGTVLEGAGSESQALQNAFSFIRGNRDPVVETLKVSSKFDATHTTCASLAGDKDTPCYLGDIMGDLFHSNPTVVASPQNFRFYFAQDPGTASSGTYADRGKSYQSFYTAHQHRRKILYAGGNDAALHAFDLGVYNGDKTTFTPTGGSAICPLCGRYDFGSGREIFAYIPRAGLNKIYNLSHTTSYAWSVDGPPTVDDVYIDVTRVSGTPQGVAASGAGADSPASTNYAWRTVLIGTEREGGLGEVDSSRTDIEGGEILSGKSGKGGSIFALDITDPDEAAHMTNSDTGGHRGVPECIVANFNPASDSNPQSGSCAAPFPRILWELRDDQSSSTTSSNHTEGGADATTQDLGMTWSQPITGRVKIKVGSTNRDFFVAIFGGGYDHSSSSPTLATTNASGNTGNFLYMVDIETGKIIYKKNLGLWASGASTASSAGRLTAGIPGTPGVVDLNNDGYLDYIYIGDTQGRLWKVDLTASATMSSSLVDSNSWNPVMFFDEYLDYQTTSARQPIFTQPAVFYAGNTSTGQPKLGIAFGTGDRDNMPVLTDTNQNSFIVLADPPGRAQAVDNDHPLTLSDLTLTTATSTNCTSSNCLNLNGYYLSLPAGSQGAQIVNTDAVVFNQKIYFNTFLHTTTTGNCNEVGTPYVYILNYLNGLSTQTDTNGNIVAYTSGAGTGTDLAEVLSTDIVFTSGGGANAMATNTPDTGSVTNITSSADSTAQQNINTGQKPAVKVKSWKEQ